MTSIRKRLFCLLLAVLLLLPAFSLAADTPASEIRVLLRRLNLTDRADLTLTGRYLVRSAGGTELLLPDGAKVTVQIREKELYLHFSGLSASLGKNVSFLRQDSGDTEPGIRFNLQAGFYPGNLKLSISDGKLQPVLTLPLETYLQGVVPYEMGDSFPPEALKAQAVCARTYALNKMDSKAEWDVVDTTNDQVFKGIPASAPKSVSAVEATAGLVLTYKNKLVPTYYSASNGGQTELPTHVWGGESPACFAVTDDPWDAANPESLTRSFLLRADASPLPLSFLKLLRKAAAENPEFAYLADGQAVFTVSRLKAMELNTPRYPAPSRLMTRLQVTFEMPPAPAAGPEETPDPEEEEELDLEEMLPAEVTVTLDLFPDVISALGLSISGSGNEIVTLAEEDEGFRLTTGRYGHGVGLSQRGAQQMAREGKKSFGDILAFYYPGSEVKKYTGQSPALPTPDPILARDPGPAPTATPRPTLMPATLTEDLPEGAYLASVENIEEDSTLNLRAEPSPGAAVLMRLFAHQKLIVLEETDVPGWVHVKTDAVEGYVMASFLIRVEEKEEPK